jgi:hypothetical protein
MPPWPIYKNDPFGESSSGHGDSDIEKVTAGDRRERVNLVGSRVPLFDFDQTDRASARDIRPNHEDTVQTVLPVPSFLG